MGRGGDTPVLGAVVQVRVEDMIYISDRAFTGAEVRECEGAILRALDFRIGMPTSYTFATRLLKAAGADSACRLMVLYMLEHSLQEFVTLQYLPSLLAAAAVYVALRHWRGAGSWTDSLRSICPWSLADMAEPVAVLRRLYGASSNPSLTAVVKKFNTPRNSFVSAIVLDQHWEMEADPPAEEDEAGTSVVLSTPGGGSSRGTPGTVGWSTMRGLDKLTLASGGGGGSAGGATGAEREAVRRERRAAALASGVELTLDTSGSEGSASAVRTPRHAASPLAGRTGGVQSRAHQQQWRWQADAVTCGSLATPGMLVHAAVLVEREGGAAAGAGAGTGGSGCCVDLT
jgi:hypothetical protein